MISLFFIFLPVIMIGIVLLIKKDKIRNWKSILCYGVLSTFASIIIATFISTFTPKNIVTLGVAIICFTLTAGLPEELCKFIAIKLSKPRSKRDILITAILVSLALTVCEDLGYVTTGGTKNAISRFLSGGHFAYQLIMAYFLIKAKQSNDSKKTLLNVSAVAVPSILHGIYDALIFLYINDNKTIAFIIGAIIYIVMIYFLLKVKKSEELEPQPKEKLGTLKVIVGILGFLIFFTLFLFDGGLTNGATPLGKEKIFDNKFSAKIISSEKTMQESIFGEEKEYNKVKVEIKNDSDEVLKFELGYGGWNIIKKSGESVTDEKIQTFGDEIKTEIQPKETATGYVYFETDYNQDDQVQLCYRKDFLEELICYKFNLK